MPQSKQQKRANAIVLYEQAIKHRHDFLYHTLVPVETDRYKRYSADIEHSISNLRKHIGRTQAKLRYS